MHTVATPEIRTADVPTLTDLTPQQIQAVELLAAGLSYTATAQQLAIGRCTLYRWRQAPAFLVLYHQLLKELADQATARSLQMLTQAQDLIQQQLSDPATPPKLRNQIALKLMSLYTPKQLQPIQALPDDAHAIACSQYLAYWKTCGCPVPEDEMGSEMEANQLLHQRRLQEAQAFDAKHGARMNRNEPSTAKLASAVQAVSVR